MNCDLLFYDDDVALIKRSEAIGGDELQCDSTEESNKRIQNGGGWSRRGVRSEVPDGVVL